MGDATDSFHFQTIIPKSDWTDAPTRFGSPVPRAAHSLATLTAASDRVTLSTVLAAALFSFARLSPEERADVYASIPATQT